MTATGIEIFLGYKCNLKCGFCFQKDLRYTFPNNIEFAKTKKLIYSGKTQGKNFIVFSGGEATLDPNLKKYISLCKELNYSDIRVHTNGILFANKKVLDEYIGLGMTGIIISIHGYGGVHDALVKMKGAFEQVKKALTNIYILKQQGCDITLDTNTVLTKYNYKNISTLCVFLSYFPITRVQLVQLYSLYLYSKNEKKRLYMPYKDFDEVLVKITKLSNINVTLENFPFCKVHKDSWRYIEERQRYDNDACGYIGEGLEESSSIFIDTCKVCPQKKKCTGVPKDYKDVFPNENFIL